MRMPFFFLGGDFECAKKTLGRVRKWRIPIYHRVFNFDFWPIPILGVSQRRDRNRFNLPSGKWTWNLPNRGLEHWFPHVFTKNWSFSGSMFIYQMVLLNYFVCANYQRISSLATSIYHNLSLRILSKSTNYQLLSFEEPMSWYFKKLYRLYIFTKWMILSVQLSTTVPSGKLT